MQSKNLKRQSNILLKNKQTNEKMSLEKLLGREQKEVRYARKALDNRNYITALDYLKVFDFHGSDPIPNGVLELRMKAWQMGLEREVQTAKNFLDNGNGIAVAAISALHTAEGYANNAGAELPSEFPALKTRAYQMAVDREFKDGQEAFNNGDYRGADYHFGMSRMYASKVAGIEVPRQLSDLQMMVDAHLRPENVVSEEVRARYAIEFSAWYQQNLGRHEKKPILYRPEERSIRELEDELVNDIKPLASRLINPEEGINYADQSYVIHSALDIIKRDSRDHYFRMRIRGMDHDEAFKDSVKSIVDLIRSVNAGRMTYEISSKIRERKDMFVWCNSNDMHGL